MRDLFKPLAFVPLFAAMSIGSLVGVMWLKDRSITPKHAESGQPQMCSSDMVGLIVLQKDRTISQLPIGSCVYQISYEQLFSKEQK